MADHQRASLAERGSAMVQPGEGGQREAGGSQRRPARGLGRAVLETLFLAGHTLQMPLMQRSRLAWPW